VEGKDGAPFFLQRKALNLVAPTECRYLYLSFPKYLCLSSYLFHVFIGSCSQQASSALKSVDTKATTNLKVLTF
jgi:hypothetical protein